MKSNMTREDHYAKIATFKVISRVLRALENLEESGCNLEVRDNLEKSGNLRKGYFFQNIQCVISILCRKFSLQQPQQHRLVILASGA